MALRLGVIGLWGHEVYARLLIEHPETELVGLAGYPGMSAEIEQRLAGLRAEQAVPYHPDPRALLRREPLDVAIVMVPPRLNPDLCTACLVMGAATVSEKPVSADEEGTRRLAAAVRASDAVYTACLPLARFAGPFAEARRRARVGELGTIEEVRFTYLAGNGPLYLATEPHYRDADVPAPALSGGEAAMFSGYGVVALEGVVGERIDSVRASLGGAWYAPYRGLAMEDLGLAVVDFPSGATGTIQVGRTPAPGAATVELSVRGSAGRFDWSSARDGEPRPNGAEEFVNDFIAAVQDGRAPWIDADDVLSSAAVLAAIYRSAQRGEAVSITHAAS